MAALVVVHGYGAHQYVRVTSDAGWLCVGHKLHEVDTQ